MNGYLNILKPPGMTSAAVVGFVRHITGEKRVGHAGTLDPDASGVLPVMIGKAARLFDYLVDKEKTYVAEIAFGASTDTQDASGIVLETGTNYPTAEQLEAAARQLTGDILQRPGIYSAIKRDGVASYKLARQGTAEELPARPVHIERIELHGEQPNHGWLMQVDCGRGTYIRSLCEDMGKLCGCPAHMRFLLRSRSGAFTLDSAMTLEQAAAYAEEKTLAEHLLPPDWPLQHIARFDAPEYLAKQVMNGVAIPTKQASPQGTAVRMYLQDRFWGIAVQEEQKLVWRAVIAPDDIPNGE